MYNNLFSSSKAFLASVLGWLFFLDMFREVVVGLLAARASQLECHCYGEIFGVATQRKCDSTLLGVSVA